MPHRHIIKKCNTVISYFNAMMSSNLNYDEIKSCYDATDDIKASTSFEFGIQNDLYYQLFYSYTDETS